MWTHYHYVRMFGGAERPETRAQFRNYCGLDSAAMVMVFRYMTHVVPGTSEARESCDHPFGDEPKLLKPLDQ